MLLHGNCKQPEVAYTYMDGFGKKLYRPTFQSLERILSVTKLTVTQYWRIIQTLAKTP